MVLLGTGGNSGGKKRPLMDQPLSFHYVREPTFVVTEPWYNCLSPYTRWGHAAQRAQKYCPKDPKGHDCQRMVELLIDCPKEYLEGIDLPPLNDPSKPVNIPPLKLRDPCKFWKWWLNKCRDYNKMNGEWKCLPFEGFVEEDCPSDWRCTRQGSKPWEGVEAWLWG